jgi:hypothetical protein
MSSSLNMHEILYSMPPDLLTDVQQVFQQMPQAREHFYAGKLAELAGILQDKELTELSSRLTAFINEFRYSSAD